jgi:pyridoxal phosphate enzyme (YggS family)
MSSPVEEIRKRLPPTVTLIAVSKTQSADAVEALHRQGQRDFGENYVQELLEKSRELEARGCTGIRWHFIGHLQTNKVKALLPVVYAIHSVDSLKLANEISKRSERKIRCFLNVNIDREASKSGFTPEETLACAGRVAGLPNIDLRGLMCIPAPRESADAIRPAFSALRELEKSCRPHTQGELSMGMSDDFEIAVSEGATSIRIGTRLFGWRNRK